MKKDLILITVSGPDHPGITSKLMKIIVESGDEITDMGQAVTHGLLSLSILLNIKSRSSGEAAVLKELLFTCQTQGLNLSFQDIEQNSELPKVPTDKFILSCVSTEGLNANFLKDIADCLAKHDINIQRIDNVDPHSFQALEITTGLNTQLNWKNVKGELLELSNTYKVDMAFLKDNIFRRSKRLIVFDMDSTLIQTEVIDEMASIMGVGDEVKRVTEMAMNGEIDFDESLKLRVSKLKGLEVTKMKTLLDKLPLTPGVEKFIKTVKSLGYKVGLISGGFSFFAEALKEKLELDYAFANDLVIENGKLTGEVDGTIINAQQKALLLKVIAQQEKISLEQVVAIGDGANDLPMLSTAGLGIAFHAKQIVKEKASQHMSHGPMTTILYFLGIPGHEQL